MLGAFVLPLLVHASLPQAESANVVVAIGDADLVVPADAAKIHVNAYASAPEVQSAHEANATTVKAILGILKSTGPFPAEADVAQTNAIHVQTGGGYPGQLTAIGATTTSYQTIGGVNATVTDLAKLSATVQIANEVQGVSGVTVNYTVKEPAALRRRALREAFLKARESAEETADAAGLHLGEVVTLESGKGASLRGLGYGSSFTRGQSVDPAQGTVEAEAHVTVRFRLVK